MLSTWRLYMRLCSHVSHSLLGRRLRTRTIVYPKIFLVAIVLLVIFHYTPPYVPPAPTPPKEPYEIFLTSSYYYPKSKSLGNNSIALVLSGSWWYFNLIQSITFVSFNSTDNVVATVPMERITPHNVCAWISIFATAPLLPNMTSVAVSIGNRLIEIPFITPSSVKRDVVTCISPLFANEQWQLLLFAAHTYKKFGSHMHLYIRSMVEPVYTLMRQYEKEGYLTIQPWLRVKLSTVNVTHFNPNINIEFRNQAAAQTDCLLQYKETAKFVSFMDLDDVLIPRWGWTYLEEYEYLFNVQPHIAFLHYNKQNVHIEGQRSPSKFSLAQMFSSIRFQKKSETGKMVTRPETFNCTWIHWPSTLPKGMIRYDVPVETNAITHLKFMDDEEHPPTKRIHAPLFNPTGGAKTGPKYLLSSGHIEDIQRDLEYMMSLPAVRKVWFSLPVDWLYFKLILDCFNNTYYKFHYGGQIDKIKCPGPDRCKFPPHPNIKCANANANFFSSSRGLRFNLHYWRNASFIIQNGCVP